MKKILLAILMLTSTITAWADPNTPCIQVRNAADTAYVTRCNPVPASRAMITFNPSTFLPETAILGTNLSFSSGVLNATFTQTKSDWNATSGDAEILHKPTLSVVAGTGAYSDLIGLPTLFSGAYADLTGKPTLFSGAYADLTGKPTLFDGQYASLTGKPTLFDGQYSSLTGVPSTFATTWSLIGSKPTTLSGYGITDAYPLTGNPSGFLTSINSAMINSALGYTPYNSSNPSGYVTQSGARASISLTTTGSGAATYNSTTGVLNVPTPSATGTVTSITAGTGLSGGTITSTGTISLPNTGTAGTYSSVTTDAQGRVTAGTTRTFNNNVSRTLNSNYTVSSTRDSSLNYSITASWTASALLGGSGTAFLEYSTDSGTTWITVNQVGKSLNLLTFTGSDDMNLIGDVPANALVRIRTTSTNMTIAYTRGQEILQ